MRRTLDAEGVRRVWDKYKTAVLVIAVGAGLMLWPAAERTERRTVEAESRDVQREMEEILGTISGVGQVRVMLTEESDGERVLAEDRISSGRGEAEHSESSETVRLDAGSGDEVVVTRRLYPTYRGALVVCQGGGQASVRLAVTQAVTALTGLPADRVAVEKWQ